MSEQSTQEAVAEIWTLFKETDARLDARIKETDARMDANLAKTAAELRKLEGLFGMQWSRLLEALVQSKW